MGNTTNIPTLPSAINRGGSEYVVSGTAAGVTIPGITLFDENNFGVEPVDRIR